MKKKLVKFFAHIAIISFNAPVLCMEGQEHITPLTQDQNQDGVYKVNCKEKILKLIQDGPSKSNYAYFATVVIRKTKNGFVRQGDLSSITAQDVHDIEEDNYVYKGCYSLEKTELFPDCKVPVAAIIVGTKDDGDIEKSIKNRRE